MTPQLSAQQIEHATKNLEARVKAKTLECASYEQLRAAAPDVIGKLFNFRDEAKQQPVLDAVHNYLTARLNFELVNLEEYELQLKAVRSMRSGVIVPGLMNHVPPRR